MKNRSVVTSHIIATTMPAVTVLAGMAVYKILETNEIYSQQEANYHGIEHDELFPFATDTSLNVQIKLDDGLNKISYDYFPKENRRIGLDDDLLVISMPQDIYQNHDLLEDLGKWISGEPVSLDSYFSFNGYDTGDLSHLPANYRSEIEVLPVRNDTFTFLPDHLASGPRATIAGYRNTEDKNQVFLYFDGEEKEESWNTYLGSRINEFIAWHEIFHVIQINEDRTMFATEIEAKADIAAAQIMEKLDPGRDYTQAIINLRAEAMLRSPMQNLLTLTNGPQKGPHGNVLTILALLNGEDSPSDAEVFEVNDIVGACINDEMRWNAAATKENFSQAATTAINKNCAQDNPDAQKVLNVVANLNQPA